MKKLIEALYLMILMLVAAVLGILELITELRARRTKTERKGGGMYRYYNARDQEK